MTAVVVLRFVTGRRESPLSAARVDVTDEWAVPADEVARGFERIEESVTRNDLDRWT